MFVKKFEAANLEDAIAMIKSEFGSDALVLSTQMRKGNLLQKASVEVTAAVERNRDRTTTLSESAASHAGGIVYHPNRAQRAALTGKMAGKPTGKLNGDSENTLAELEGRPRYIDIDAEPSDLTMRTNLPRGRAASADDGHNRHNSAGFRGLETLWLDSGFRPETAKEMTARLWVDFNPNDLRDKGFSDQVRAGLLSETVRTLSPEVFDTKRKWLIVGGPGSGKTSTAVRLAIYLKRLGKEVALSSWEDRKVTSFHEAKGYAKLIGVPYLPPSAASESSRIVLYDTSAWEPGFPQCEKWSTEKFDSVLLVVDARERFNESLHLSRRISEKLQITSLGFSRLDLVQSRGFLFDMLRSSRVPLLGVSSAASYKTPYRFFEPLEFSEYVIGKSHKGLT